MSNIIRVNWGHMDAITRALVEGLSSGKIQLTGFEEDCNHEKQITLNFLDNSISDSDDDVADLERT